MIKLKGMPTSPGIAIAEAFVFKKEERRRVKSKAKIDIQREISRFAQALERTKREIKMLRDKVMREVGDKEAAIFDAHILMLEDSSFISKIENLIRRNGLSAEDAVRKTIDELVEMFERMDNIYMRARAEDLRDLGNQLISNLLLEKKTHIVLTKPSIVIAKELLPSDIAKLEKRYLLGFVTERGGVTSHVSIIARTLGVPAVVAIKDATKHIRNNDVVIVDGYTGDVIINPSDEVLEQYRERMRRYELRFKAFKEACKMPATTKDNVVFKVCANVGNPDEAYLAIENGADGIGLLRTEFLIMNTNELPSEDDMFKKLTSIVKLFEGKDVIIRTFDVGGDKPVPFIKVPREANPFLGLRGTRLMLRYKEVLRRQLRAILRASTKGNVKIMFPMISDIDEVIEAKKVLEDVVEELKSEGIGIGKYYVGIMIETPSAAILADMFIDYVDFFSIGTNDLTQYTLAVDRTNEEVAYLFDHLHPSILRLIEHVVRVAHEKGKWVSVCGEMASDIEAIPILIGLGVDELSVAPPFIPVVKGVIRSLHLKDAKELARKALTMKRASDVRGLSRKLLTSLGLY
ncbi:MAG: phosphoenolpyruvate--protein phosphotransferase [Thermoprotei archaeon]|nr:MAG: phosphoenolpyruvate--protein phosphotransferase [Thermoprotei archaeon]